MLRSKSTRNSVTSPLLHENSSSYYHVVFWLNVQLSAVEQTLRMLNGYLTRIYKIELVVTGDYDCRHWNE